MVKRPTLTFHIARMDSLGQGVSKSDDKITFIPKTLPGEKGSACVVAKRKGVVFARVEKISEESPDRIKPSCPHFDHCPSCHYLHTPYEAELEFKRQSLAGLFRKIQTPEIEVIGAMRRDSYRNRVQLHYDLKSKKIGMLDIGANQIAPIPQCLIVRPELKEKLKELYSEDNWLREASGQKPTGHLELYLLDGEVKKSWNRPYAEGGFTQVFEEMNQVLKNELIKWWGESKKDLLDLFGGNGNLSKDLSYSRRLCVDIYNSDQGKDFFSQHLYAEDALKNVLRKTRQNELQSPDLLIDPPRSGLKNLNEWLAAFGPSRVAYVSCDPHTLARDVSQLEGYKIDRLMLLDFFPSTYHFETVIFLTRQE